LPLFLIPRTHGQGAALCCCVTLLPIVQASLMRDGVLTFEGLVATIGPLTTLFIYLPCTWMVLDRGRLVGWIRARIGIVPS
jgi:hypothetical protein